MPLSKLNIKLSISGHHVEVTPALKQYVTEKLDRLQRHFNHITQINITLSVENKIDQKAEANINLAGGKIFADHRSEDMYKSIDNLIDKLDRQVIKHKEKMRDHGDGEKI